MTMKFHIVAIAILSLVASRAHGRVARELHQDDDADADAAADVALAERRCRYAHEEMSQYDLFQALTNGQRACMGDAGFVVRQLMTEAKAMEDMREVFRTACEGAPEFHRCLEEVTEDARQCFDEEDIAFKMYRNERDFIEAAVETTCSNGSDAITVLMHVLANLNNDASMAEPEKCLSVLEESRFTNRNRTEFTAEFSQFRYQMVCGVKECIGGVIAGEIKPEAGEVVAHFFDEILAKMTCICSETFVVGLCADMYHTVDV